MAHATRLQARIALLAVLVLGGCATAPPPADPTLHAWDAAFVALHEDDPVEARALLGEVIAQLDDLSLSSAPVPSVLLADGAKPYRGQPHERVMTALILGALDANAGRCDLALPSFRAALYFRAAAHRHTRAPPSGTDALALGLIARCLRALNAPAGDLQEAERAFNDALDHVDPAMRTALVHAGDAAPFALVLRAGASPASGGDAAGADAGGPPAAAASDVCITLGAPASAHCRAASAVEVVSAAQERAGVAPRAFERTLRARSGAKGAAFAAADAAHTRADAAFASLRDALTRGGKPLDAAAAGAVWLTAAGAASAIGGGIDDTADRRSVTAMPESICVDGG